MLPLLPNFINSGAAERSPLKEIIRQVGASLSLLYYLFVVGVGDIDGCVG
jgi:hypothetical protein